MNDYKDFKWIKVKKHIYDPEKTWQENYQDLSNHHLEETKFLIAELQKLAEGMRDLEKNLS